MAVRACCGVLLRTTIGFLLLGSLTLAQAPLDEQRIIAEIGEAMGKNEYARVLELLKSIPEDASPKLVARKHTSAAIALTNLGRYAEVPPHIARARQIGEQLKDPGVLASVDSAEATSHRLARRLDLAIPLYERAIDLAQNAGDRSMLGRIYGQLGGAYSSLEDYERATYYRQKGFQLLENPTASERFNNAIDRGIAYFELYDRDNAEAMFKEALALALQSGGKRDESFARGELAYTYWTFDKDAAGAIGFYAHAIALAVEAQTPSLVSTWTLNRGTVWRDTGEFEQALNDFRHVLAIEKAAGTRDVFAATKNIGQTYRLMGRLEEAKNVLEPLLKERPGNPSPRHVWQAHMELASTHEALGDRGSAEAQFKQMLDVLEEHRNSSILDTFRSGSFAHTLARYDPYDRYLRFLAMDPAGPRTAEALHIVERARARGFLETLASVRSALAASLPPNVLEEQTAILRGITTVQRRLRAPELARADREALLAELAGLERKREDFRVKLRIEHPALADARYPQVAAAQDLQRSLRAGETAIVFYLSEPDSFRWVVTRDRVTLDRIAPRNTIEAQANRLRGLLKAPGDVAPVRAEAAALSALLLKGVRTEAERPLLVVPHGVLHYVPFEVLPLDGIPLIARNAVSYAPSLNSYAHLRAQKPQPASFRVLAVGNPTVDRPDAVTATSRSGDIDTVALLGPLPFAEEELRAIRRVFRWSTETLSGTDARESTFRAEDLARYPIIHFATHGLVNENRPARSGLLFSPEAGEDGLLQMQEIYRLGLQAELVVLSACQTALGREITGEGLVGLTRAFFYAGSRSVVAALWNLSDRFAADFVEKFYAEIGAGRTTEDALRRTKIAYLNHPQYAHPFYWSSLILTGDGTRTLYRPSRWTPVAYVLLPAALIALSAAAALRYRRRRP